MPEHKCFSRIVILVFVGLSATQAIADISGFGFLHPAEWKLNVGDAGPLPLVTEEGRIQLTNASQGSQRRSIFFLTQQSVSSFHAEFTYEASGVSGSETGGACFVIQRNSVNAVGGSQGNLGYASGGFIQSVALTLELNGSRSALFTNGTLTGGSNPTAPVDLRSGNPILITINSEGGLMTVDMTDLVTQDMAPTRFYPIDLTGNIGGSEAWVGVTTGTRHGASQFLDDLLFTSPGQDCASLQEGDLNGDGSVDLTDLALFLTNFGAGCP